MPEFDASFAYLRTIGRRTGKSHEVELWFASEDNILLFLAHEGSDWWKNIKANAKVEVKIGTRDWEESQINFEDESSRCFGRSTAGRRLTTGTETLEAIDESCKL